MAVPGLVRIGFVRCLMSFFFFCIDLAVVAVVSLHGF